MENRNRKHEIHLRLDDREYAALERNRKKCGLEQQTYLRFLCLNVVPKEQPPADFLKFYRQLQQIGNNLNQIAWRANRDGRIDTKLYWDNIRWLQNEMCELQNQILFWKDDVNERT